MASALSDRGGSEWRYYKEITVHENSGRTLTDFQVLVELSDANFGEIGACFFIILMLSEIMYINKVKLCVRG